MNQLLHMHAHSGQGKPGKEEGRFPNVVHIRLCIMVLLARMISDSIMFHQHVSPYDLGCIRQSLPHGSWETMDTSDNLSHMVPESPALPYGSWETMDPPVSLFHVVPERLVSSSSRIRLTIRLFHVNSGSSSIRSSRYPTGKRLIHLLPMHTNSVRDIHIIIQQITYHKHNNIVHTGPTDTRTCTPYSHTQLEYVNLFLKQYNLILVIMCEQWARAEGIQWHPYDPSLHHDTWHLFSSMYYHGTQHLSISASSSE